MTKLFLFPHQDDEFGVFYLLEKYIRDGNHVVCIFLTESGVSKKITSIRNSESVSVLLKLGIPRNDIFFLGEIYSIQDGMLLKKMRCVGDWLAKYLTENTQIREIFVPAWEGGHPDHDAINAVATIISHLINRPIKIWQYPLYNAKNLSFGMFRVLSPIKSNGFIHEWKIPIFSRIKYLIYCFSYRSQWRSWLGLWPMMAFKYLISGKQFIQEANVRRLDQPPHSGKLYYETRKFDNWKNMNLSINIFIDSCNNIPSSFRRILDN